MRVEVLRGFQLPRRGLEEAEASNFGFVDGFRPAERKRGIGRLKCCGRAFP